MKFNVGDRVVMNDPKDELYKKPVTIAKKGFRFYKIEENNSKYYTDKELKNYGSKD